MSLASTAKMIPRLFSRGFLIYHSHLTSSVKHWKTRFSKIRPEQAENLPISRATIKQLAACPLPSFFLVYTSWFPFNFLPLCCFGVCVQVENIEQSLWPLHRDLVAQEPQRLLVSMTATHHSVIGIWSSCYVPRNTWKTSLKLSFFLSCFFFLHYYLHTSIWQHIRGRKKLSKFSPKNSKISVLEKLKKKKQKIW